MSNGTERLGERLKEWWANWIEGTALYESYTNFRRWFDNVLYRINQLVDHPRMFFKPEDYGLLTALGLLPIFTLDYILMGDFLTEADEQYIGKVPFPKLDEWFFNATDRYEEVRADDDLFWYGDQMSNVVAWWMQIVLQVYYVLTGVGKGTEGRMTPKEIVQEAQEPVMEGGKRLMQGWLDLAKSDAVKNTADAMGTAVLNPVLNVLLPPPGTEDIDGIDTAQRFTGLVMGLPLAGALMDTAYSWLPGDGEADFEGATDTIYWSLGLGFLGWQSLSPALRIALQDPMERHYNKIYRPERFPLSTLLNLYMLDSIGSAQVLERGAELGWKAEDMNLLIEEAKSQPSRADLRKMRDKGLIGIEEHRNYLIKHGYRGSELDYILKIDEPKVEEESLTTYRSTLKNAYEEGLIDSIEFRSHAEDLGWSSTEIDLQLALLDLERENEIKTIAKNDVERGYKQGTLTHNDVRNILQANDFSPQAIDHLIQLWDKEITEPARRITSGSVQGAIIQGVLDPEHAAGLLVDTGYPKADADVLVRTAVEQRTRAPSEATVGAYVRAYRKGLIDIDTFREGLRGLGYTERAIHLYTQLAEATSGESEESITESKALRLYRYGRWTYDEMIQWLLKEGYNQEKATDLIWLEGRRIEEADVVSAYQQSFISQDEAIDRLVAIGYTVPIALETLGERKRKLSKSDALSGFVLGLLTYNGALGMLQSLDYSETDAEFLVISELFATGVENVLRRYRTNDISYEEGHARLRVLGYGDEVARQMLQEAVLLPGKLHVVEAYQVGLLNTSEATNSLTLIGMITTEAHAVLATSVREHGKEQVTALYDQDFIAEAEALTRLALLGYSRSEGRDFLREERVE